VRRPTGSRREQPITGEVYRRSWQFYSLAQCHAQVQCMPSPRRLRTLTLACGLALSVSVFDWLILLLVMPDATTRATNNVASEFMNILIKFGIIPFASGNSDGGHSDPPFPIEKSVSKACNMSTFSIKYTRMSLYLIGTAKIISDSGCFLIVASFNLFLLR